MARKSKYDWPPTEGLVALCQEHGVTEAARRLGVNRSTLRDHLDAEGVAREDYARKRQGFSDEVLKEIAELCR